MDPALLVRPSKARRLIAEVIQATEITKFRDMVAKIKEQMWRLRRQDNNVRLELAVLEKVEEMLQQQAHGKIIECLPSQTKHMDCTSSIAALEVLKDASVMKYVSSAVQSTRGAIQEAVQGIAREVAPEKSANDSQFWTLALEAMSYFHEVPTEAKESHDTKDGSGGKLRGRPALQAQLAIWDREVDTMNIDLLWKQLHGITAFMYLLSPEDQAKVPSSQSLKFVCVCVCVCECKCVCVSVCVCVCA